MAGLRKEAVFGGLLKEKETVREREGGREVEGGGEGGGFEEGESEGLEVGFWMERGGSEVEGGLGETLMLSSRFGGGATGRGSEEEDEEGSESGGSGIGGGGAGGGGEDEGTSPGNSPRRARLLRSESTRLRANVAERVHR